MGIIKAFGTAVSSAAADQWKECFYCGSMEGGLLQTRGVRMESARSVNRGSSDVITDGSLIIVADGQCAIATESGAIIGVYDQPGENIRSIAYAKLDSLADVIDLMEENSSHG